MYMTRRAKLALAIGLWIAAAACSGQEMTAHFIDVGQGDATLLEFPCGAILIDAVILGYATSWVVPGRLGELVRPALLAGRQRLPLGPCLGSVVADRLLDGMAVLALFVVGGHDCNQRWLLGGQWVPRRHGLRAGLQLVH